MSATMQTRLYALAGLVILAGAGLGAWMLGRPGGDDVGQHPAIAPLLTGLAGLPACGIRYRMHQRDSREQVLLDQCDPIVSFPTPGRVAVPSSEIPNDVHFLARRARVNDPWQLAVDKDRLPLDRLVSALTAFTPHIQRQGAALIARARKTDEEARERARTHDSDEERARERSRSSYER